jgi:hypothetical protein
MQGQFERIQQAAEIAAALAQADPIYAPIHKRMQAEAEMAGRARKAPEIALRKKFVGAA